MKRFFIIMILCISLFGSTKVFAKSDVNLQDNYNTVIFVISHGYTNAFCSGNDSVTITGDSSHIQLSIQMAQYYNSSTTDFSYPIFYSDYAGYSFHIYDITGNIIVAKGNVINNSSLNDMTYDEYIDPDSGTWYNDAWNIFKTWLVNTPWDDNNIPKMIKDFWHKWIHGDNEPDDINIIGYSTPTPQPTPTPKPTQIPYSVSLIDINGGQEIIYNYVDPTSGLPTSSPYNPNIEINIGGGSNGSNITTPVPVILATGTPEFQNILFTSEDSKDLEINVNQIGEYIDVIENGLIENTGAMEEVSNIFSILPNNWFMIIGIIACIPIIAAVISRFLH